jgi:hypothetical protein
LADQTEAGLVEGRLLQQAAFSLSGHSGNTRRQIAIRKLLVKIWPLQLRGQEIGHAGQRRAMTGRQSERKREAALGL